MVGLFKRLMGTGLEALFPFRCIACQRLYRRDPPLRSRPEGDFSHQSFKNLMSAYLCPSCGERFQPIISPLCTHCGQPFVSRHGPDHVCGSCQRQPFRFQKARSAGLYQDVLRTLIHHYKYHGRVQLAGPLGGLLWQVFVAHWEPRQIDYIVPVPLHKKRLRGRGFNQAHLLVQSWPQLTGAREAGIERGRIAAHLLERCRATAPQTGLNRHQREANVRQAFRLTRKQHVRGRHFLLVDDVLTTGATADACARILLASGAASVQVLTLARAV